MIYRSLKKGSVQATSGHLETLKPGETLEMRSSQMTHAQKTFLQTRKLLVTGCVNLCAKQGKATGKNTPQEAFTYC